MNEIEQDVNNEGAHKGKRMVLLSSYVGSHRFMEQLYFDGMAISSQIRFLDLFITFTCNPKWPEVQRLLSNVNLHPQDCPNVILRFFKIKFDEMMCDLTKKHVLGKVLTCKSIKSYILYIMLITLHIL